MSQRSMHSCTTIDTCFSLLLRRRGPPRAAVPRGRLLCPSVFRPVAAHFPGRLLLAPARGGGRRRSGQPHRSSSSRHSSSRHSRSSSRRSRPAPQVVPLLRLAAAAASACGGGAGLAAVRHDWAQGAAAAACAGVLVRAGAELATVPPHGRPLSFLERAQFLSWRRAGCCAASWPASEPSRKRAQFFSPVAYQCINVRPDLCVSACAA